MDNANLLKTGIISTVLVGICCFTPALVIALGAVGLGAYIAGLDRFLLPLFDISLALTLYACFRIWRNKRAKTQEIEDA